VNIVSSFEGEIDLKSGRYVVDAKSIMGIFSLDLLNPIEMTVHCDSCDAIIENLKDFIID
jgi:phosphotransferase system HPr-like phosphotransfer protein